MAAQAAGIANAKPVYKEDRVSGFAAVIQIAHNQIHLLLWGFARAVMSLGFIIADVGELL
jgi:hypothetical protein